MQRISELLVKRLSSRLSADEEAELQAWRDKDEENNRLYERLTDPSSLKASLDLWHMVDSQRACSDMQYRVNVILRRRLISRYVAVAAVFAVLFGLAALFHTGTGSRNGGNAAVAEAERNTVITAIEGIKPGVTYALLSDAAGNNVELHAADTVNVAALLLDGVSDTVYRDLCLEVPRGGEFKIQLEDGTEVWLNSASRLYYPKTFNGDVRKVRVEGEAYLSVATDSLRPFYVETDNQLIRVYGTSFNVRYYGSADFPGGRWELSRV